MSLSRREFMRHAAAGLALPLLRPGTSSSRLAASPSAPFAPTWESLSNYTAPEWFRDAKFGLWAHWGPQCQPERGDWYAVWYQCLACAEWFVTPKRIPLRRAIRAQVPTMSFFGPTFMLFHP